MSMYSLLSIICLVACAKRASSRSIGGMLKKPGRKLMSDTITSATIARACEGGAARIHHGEADEAGAVGLPEEVAPGGRVADRHAIDQDRQRRDPAGDLER